MNLNKYDILKLPDILKGQLQKTLDFELKNKVFKRGQLDLYKIDLTFNNYDIVFILNKSSNKKETFKIPCPFVIEHYVEENSDVLFFDYRLSTFCNNDKNIESRLISKLKKYDKKSKYLNSILKITCK